MKFFMSGEVSDPAYHDFRIISNEVEARVKKLLEENDYGENVVDLAIIPTLFSSEFEQSLKYKERKRYSPKTKEAEFRLKINFQEFLDADKDGKKRLIIKNIIDSIRILKTKVKKGFDGDRMEQDILKLFNLQDGE